MQDAQPKDLPSRLYKQHSFGLSATKARSTLIRPHETAFSPGLFRNICKPAPITNPNPATTNPDV